MAQNGIPAEQLQQLQDFAANWGKIIARRATEGTQGQPPLDFRSMEQVADAAAAGLVQGTLQALVEQQTQLLDEQEPCPDCGRLCEVRSEQRRLVVPRTTVTLDEPVCRCPDCRRDFFPSTPVAGPGQSHL